MRGPVFRAVEHVRTGKPYRLGTVPGRGRIRVTRGADSTAGKYRGSPAHPALTAPFRSKTPQPVALVPFRRKPQSLFASAARAAPFWQSRLTHQLDTPGGWGILSP